ncbi:leucyl/phenylalanyl-tRNA--protein transferase [Pseudidiomarina sp.]|uniref:leucyl/phenylalanyl-tRNA--protein transferase n=1 Tax=Pseudidiomarina sp. TaxID=2081707 RepID=UPI00299CF21F|nr:leucyl/phenylalanyl-tRNA--protein transferase [Pseudidiomarina sp.]MDX1705456.1 leucyl/phenylalanyl-tRNA--protein transferase [Pseudidiomarina sp.]
MLFQLSENNLYFPNPALALTEPDGLLAFGGDLSPERLQAAYRQGIFPWYGADDPILWWSPDPRTVFTPGSLHCSRSMRRFIRQTELKVTLNRDFPAVIRHCADAHKTAGTWIHPEMISAYIELHTLGQAHSIEIWHQHQLVGGMYGVAVGGIFCGESMFHYRTNASKLALLVFCQNFFAAGGELLDAQVDNPHLQSLGAWSLPRIQYLALLNQQNASHKPNLAADFWQKRTLTGI